MRKFQFYACLCLTLVLLCLQACQPVTNHTANHETVIPTASLENIPNSEAGDIVRKAIESAGGWEAWSSKKALSYIKTITFYDSTGEVTRVSRQLHEYNLHPRFQARISYEDNGKKYVILNNGQQAWKLEDGKIMTDEASKNSSWNSSFGSHYVMCMPFKLADHGAQFAFDGKTILPNGKEVNSIKVTYLEGAGSSALYHTWWYFFDPSTHELVANFLDFGNGYDYTEYLAFTSVDGIKLNQRRKSYKSDSLRMDIKVSSSYVNEEVQFMDALPLSYFEPTK